MSFQNDTTDAGASARAGRRRDPPVDLVSRPTGRSPTRAATSADTTILSVKDRTGEHVVPATCRRRATRSSARSRPSSSPTSCAGTRTRAVNPFWGEFQIRDENGDYRQATLKTGTNNDAKDLNAYGYIAPPTEAGREDGAYALAVGVWNGNSDNTPVSTPAKPVFSIDVATFVWQGFLHEASAELAADQFKAPDSGLDPVAIDPFTGLLPGRRLRRRRGVVPQRHRAEGAARRGPVRRGGHRRRRASRTSTTPGWRRTATGCAAPSGGRASSADPDRTRTSYFYNNAVQPVRPHLGRARRRRWLRPGEPVARPASSCRPRTRAASCPSFAIPSPDPAPGRLPSPARRRRASRARRPRSRSARAWNRVFRRGRPPRRRQPRRRRRPPEPTPEPTDRSRPRNPPRSQRPRRSRRPSRPSHRGARADGRPVRRSVAVAAPVDRRKP